MRFNAADGSDLDNLAARIVVEVDGTPGNNDTPGRMAFYTAPDGSATAVERMRLDQGGNLILGGTSAQASDAVTLRQDGEVTAAGFYFSNNIGSAMNDTGIRRATTNTMVFDTDSKERIRVNADGYVTPLDAVMVINHLNNQGSERLTGYTHVAPFVDVNTDGFVAPIDPLLVVNHLNANSSANQGAPSSGEGEWAERIADVIFVEQTELKLANQSLSLIHISEPTRPY